MANNKKKRTKRFTNGFWNHQRRLDFYKRLKNEFGPFSKWKSSSIPPEPHTSKDLFAFLKKVGDLYQHLDEKSPQEWEDKSEALNNQLAWALTKQQSVPKDGIINWAGNVVAAKEAGFITNKHLPEVLLKGE